MKKIFLPFFILVMSLAAFGQIDLTTVPTETTIDPTNDRFFFNDVSETPDALNQTSVDSIFNSIKASTTNVLTGTATNIAVTPDALAAIWEQGSNTSSASTVTLGEGGYFHITGTTTITDIDLATDKAGRHFWLTFDGVLTLTYNATTLILPGSNNITTAAGDTALFVSEGSDVVRCLFYHRRASLPATQTGAETLTNKTLQDSTTSFADNGDATRKMQFQLSGITTATTRTLTVPDADLTIVGTTTSQTLTNKALTAPAITGASTLTSDGSNAIGYTSGGGTVTQLTSKSTGVTLNKTTGAITTHNASLAAGTSVSFTFTNSKITVEDVLIINRMSGGTAGKYIIDASCGSGSATITITNISAGSLGEALTLQFAVIQASNT